MGAPVVMLPALRAGESWRVKRKCMTKGERESPREPWVKEGQEGGDRGSDRGALGQELDAMRPVKLVMLMGGSCHLAASCHPAGRVAWLGCRTRRMLGAPTLSPPSCWSRGAWTVGARHEQRLDLLGALAWHASRLPRLLGTRCGAPRACSHRDGGGPRRPIEGMGGPPRDWWHDRYGRPQASTRREGACTERYEGRLGRESGRPGRSCW